jgi:hypothetical protein
LPAGLVGPGSSDDLAASLEALARGNPGLLGKPGDKAPGTGPGPSDLPAGFGRFRRGKRDDRS